jgi:hypothetical protein
LGAARPSFGVQTLSMTWPAPAAGVKRVSWRAMAGALRGDVLAAFPDEAFEQEVVVQSFAFSGGGTFCCTVRTPFATCW